MPLFRRILTFAIGLMLLQGNLAAAMLPCGDDHGSAGAEHVSTAGAGMGDMAAAHLAMGHRVATQSSTADADGNHQCDQRDHPANCASMVSCIAIGAPAAPTGIEQRQPAVELAVVSNTDAPRSRTLLPDVPPPRV